MKRKYRLTHGKFHVPAAEGGLKTYQAGEIIELSDAQAQLMRRRIQGPLSDEAAASAEAAPVTISGAGTPEGQATEDVKRSVDQLKDIIRNADMDYLTALQTAEAAREGGPRTRVFEMIDRRKKGLEAPAA